MLTKPCRPHNAKYPFINYLQLFTLEGPGEAHGAGGDSWAHARGAAGPWEEPRTPTPWCGHQGWPGDAAQGRMFPACCSTEIHSKAHGLGKACREAHLSQTQAKSELQLPYVSQRAQKWLLNWKSYFTHGLYVLSLSVSFTPWFTYTAFAQFNKWKLWTCKDEIHFWLGIFCDSVILWCTVLGAMHDPIL